MELATHSRMVTIKVLWGGEMKTLEVHYKLFGFQGFKRVSRGMFHLKEDFYVVWKNSEGEVLNVSTNSEFCEALDVMNDRNSDSVLFELFLTSESQQSIREVSAEDPDSNCAPTAKFVDCGDSLNNLDSFCVDPSTSTTTMGSVQLSDDRAIESLDQNATAKAMDLFQVNDSCESIELHDCPTCSRRFSEIAIKKHIPFCLENTNKPPRPKFNSGTMRLKAIGIKSATLEGSRSSSKAGGVLKERVSTKVKRAIMRQNSEWMKHPISVRNPSDLAIANPRTMADCKFCHRKFAPGPFKIHEPVCAQKENWHFTRGVFCSAKQRARGNWFLEDRLNKLMNRRDDGYMTKKGRGGPTTNANQEPEKRRHHRTKWRVLSKYLREQFLPAARSYMRKVAKLNKIMNKGNSPTVGAAYGRDDGKVI